MPMYSWTVAQQGAKMSCLPWTVTTRPTMSMAGMLAASSSQAWQTTRKVFEQRRGFPR